MAKVKARKKDPDAVLDYAVDFRPTKGEVYLALGETIESTEVSVFPSGLVIEAHAVAQPDKDRVIVWLSGGELGRIYIVRVKVVLNNGRVDYRSFNIIVERT